MDTSGRGALDLAVALREAHFRLRALARSWEEALPGGRVLERRPLGPSWSYDEAPDQAAYGDGQAVQLDERSVLLCELAVNFRAAGVDMAARITLETDGEDCVDLLATGPLEFPDSSDDLVREIRRCLASLEQADLTAVLTG